MTRSEIQKIVDRDIFGWELAKNAKISQSDRNTFMIVVENGTRKKVVVISNRSVLR